SPQLSVAWRALPRLGASTPSVNVSLSGLKTPSSALVIIIALTLLSVAPSLLILMTGFTRIFMVLGLTRNALGLQTTPPNQVLAGLALFLSLFVMGPVLSQVDHQAVQPYLHGTITATQAISNAEAPVKSWMLRQTGTDELSLFTTEAHETTANLQSLPMTTVVPAFVLSQVQSAMLIGFIVFIPFMVIDIAIASILMSMGMFMLPPSLISLPFKILLFVLVDGWALVVHSLLASFH
ncbi:MAG TPA: flagellar type III secretion system pore protein FliP, partial [Acidimicrobiales bacterium]|nr:flagellar type III secretion system pore protein FliP [Acidimicrobiales bacterium]